MKASIWGPNTWNLLHIIAEKVYEDKFDLCKNDIYKMISLICSSIPCPICKENATTYLNKNNINKADNKTKLKEYIFNLHNEANVHANNPISDKSVLKRYETLSFSQVFYTYYNLYSKNKSDDIQYSFRKTINLRDLYIFLQVWFMATSKPK